MARALIETYEEQPGGNTTSCHDEFDRLALDRDPAVQRDIASCIGAIAGRADTKLTEIDVKSHDAGHFPNSDPCLEICGSAVVAYCVDVDANGYVTRVMILGCARTSTGIPPVPAGWLNRFRARLRNYRSSLPP